MDAYTQMDAYSCSKTAVKLHESDKIMRIDKFFTL